MRLPVLLNVHPSRLTQRHLLEEEGFGFHTSSFLKARNQHRKLLAAKQLVSWTSKVENTKNQWLLHDIHCDGEKTWPNIDLNKSCTYVDDCIKDHIYTFFLQNEWETNSFQNDCFLYKLRDDVPMSRLILAEVYIWIYLIWYVCIFYICKYTSADTTCIVYIHTVASKLHPHTTWFVSLGQNTKKKNNYFLGPKELPIGGLPIRPICRKINTEPENHPCSKENDLPNPSLLCSMLIFRGVSFPRFTFHHSAHPKKKKQPFLWLQPVCRFSTSSLRPSTNSSPRIWAGPIHNYLLLASRDSWRVDGLILVYVGVLLCNLRVCQLLRAGGGGGGFCCCCCRQYSCSHCFGLNITRLIPYFSLPNEFVSISLLTKKSRVARLFGKDISRWCRQ